MVADRAATLLRRQSLDHLVVPAAVLVDTVRQLAFPPVHVLLSGTLRTENVVRHLPSSAARTANQLANVVGNATGSQNALAHYAQRQVGRVRRQRQLPNHLVRLRLGNVVVEKGKRFRHALHLVRHP